MCVHILTHPLTLFLSHTHIPYESNPPPSQGEFVTEDWKSTDKQWCSHVDNSINFLVKHVEVHAVPEEMGA